LKALKTHFFREIIFSGDLFMLMRPDQEAKYWRLASYIKIHLPQAYYSKKIVKNMKSYGSLNKAKFGHALIWGTEPEIVIGQLSSGFCRVNKAFGCFDPANPRVIILDEGLVQKFQNDPNNPSTRFHSGSGGSLPIVGCTILHELCHWGNFKGRLNEEALGREMGTEFEIATYGAIVGTAGGAVITDDEADVIKPD